MADGIFQVRDLTVTLSEVEFVVECGATAMVKDCGQPTAKGFALRFGNGSMSLDELKEALEYALSGVEALKAREALRPRRG